MPEARNSQRSILVIDSRTEVFEVIQNIVESEDNIEVVHTTKLDEAIDFLVKNPTIQMIFASYEMQGGDSSALFLKNFELNNLPFFYISGIPKSEMKDMDKFDKNPVNEILKRPPEFDQISECIYTVLKTNIKMLFDKGDTNVAKLGEVYLYVVKLDSFIKRKKTFSNVFIKIGNDKLVKVANAGEDIDPSRFKKYQDKGLEYIYLSREEYSNYLDTVFGSLKKVLVQDNLKPSEQLKAQMAAVDQVQDVVKTIGLSEEVIEMSEKVTESIVNTIQKNKNVLPFLQKMIQKENYFSEHANIMNYIITAICIAMDWSTMSVIEKMIRSTIFADCAFDYDQEQLAMVHSRNDQAYKELPLLERKIIDKHMDDANKFIANAGEFLTDEPMLIANHHERPDGSGFPKGIDKNKTPPLCAAFNIAYQFSHHLLTADDPSLVDPKKILELMGDEYGKGNYRKPYLALKKSLRIKD